MTAINGKMLDAVLRCVFFDAKAQRRKGLPPFKNSKPTSLFFRVDVLLGGGSPLRLCAFALKKTRQTFNPWFFMLLPVFTLNEVLA